MVVRAASRSSRSSASQTPASASSSPSVSPIPRSRGRGRGRPRGRGTRTRASSAVSVSERLQLLESAENERVHAVMDVDPLPSSEPDAFDTLYFDQFVQGDESSITVLTGLSYAVSSTMLHVVAIHVSVHSCTRSTHCCSSQLSFCWATGLSADFFELSSFLSDLPKNDYDFPWPPY
jgi:hypothetical protein